MSGDQVIPEDLRKFIDMHIDSVEQLEVLLLLRRSAGRSWTVEAVSEDLRSSDMSARIRLQDLTSRGMLERELAEGKTLFRYAPRDGRLAALIDRLADLYASRPARLIELIFSKPTDQLKALADSFRLRRTEDEER